MNGGSITVKRDSDYNQLLSEKLTCFRKRRKFTDCKIIVGGETFECHANIVSAFSPMFERMIESNMAEGLSKEVTFKTLKADVMQIIMDYIYTGKVTVKKQHIMGLVESTDYLQMLDLRDKILLHITEILTPDNVIGWARLASLLQLQDVTLRCKQLISASYKQVSKGKEFTELPVEELDCCLCDASEMKVSSDDLIASVLAWINCDVEHRSRDLDETLHWISPDGCSRQTLADIADQYQFILDANPHFCKAVTTLLQQNQPPCSTLQQSSSLVVTAGETGNTCWKLNARKQFEEFTKVPEYLFSACHRICVYEGVGLVYTGGLTKTTCALYHAATRQWKQLQNLRQERLWHASVCILQKLFVIGGDVAGFWSTSVEFLSLEEEQAEWESSAAMPTTLWHSKSAYLDANVFLMGNNNPQLFCFDVAQKEWSLQSPLPQDPGCAFRMAAGADSVFAVGGDQNISYMYTPATDNWVKVSQPCLRHQSGALIFHDERLVLLGGGSGDIEEYDVEKDTWTILPYKLPHRLQFHFAFSMHVPD